MIIIRALGENLSDQDIKKFVQREHYNYSITIVGFKL